jgi:hypothetical protein
MPANCPFARYRQVRLLVWCDVGLQAAPKRCQGTHGGRFYPGGIPTVNVVRVGCGFAFQSELHGKHVLSADAARCRRFSSTGRFSLYVAWAVHHLRRLFRPVARLALQLCCCCCSFVDVCGEAGFRVFSGMVIE